MPRHPDASTWCRARRPCLRPFAIGVVLLAGALACEPALLGPPRYGELHITIATQAGAPLPDIPIVLYTGARPIEYAHTDASGRYLFERVPAGNYGVLGAMPAGMCNPDGSTTLVKDDLDVVPEQRFLLTFTIHLCASAPAGG